MEKIRGLFITVEQVIKHALKSGELIADREIITRRLEICRVCEFLEGSRCKHCGCFMALKGGLVAARCPIGKW
jgi:hypothetical protein